MRKDHNLEDVHRYNTITMNGSVVAALILLVCLYGAADALNIGKINGRHKTDNFSNHFYSIHNPQV